MPRPQQQKRYLRVETPQTTDGKTLRYDEDRQVVMKVSFLPITAKAELLRNTSKLPEYLRPTLTEMEGDAAPKAQKAPVVNPGGENTTATSGANSGAQKAAANGPKKTAPSRKPQPPAGQ